MSDPFTETSTDDLYVLKVGEQTFTVPRASILSRGQSMLSVKLQNSNRDLWHGKVGQFPDNDADTFEKVILPWYAEGVWSIPPFLDRAATYKELDFWAIKIGAPPGLSAEAEADYITMCLSLSRTLIEFLEPNIQALQYGLSPSYECYAHLIPAWVLVRNDRLATKFGKHAASCAKCQAAQQAEQFQSCLQVLLNEGPPVDQHEARVIPNVLLFAGKSTNVADMKKAFIDVGQIYRCTGLLAHSPLLHMTFKSAMANRGFDVRIEEVINEPSAKPPYSCWFDEVSRLAQFPDRLSGGSVNIVSGYAYSRNINATRVTIKPSWKTSPGYQVKPAQEKLMDVA